MTFVSIPADIHAVAARELRALSDSLRGGSGSFAHHGQARTQSTSPQLLSPPRMKDVSRSKQSGDPRSPLVLMNGDLEIHSHAIEWNKPVVSSSPISSFFSNGPSISETRTFGHSSVPTRPDSVCSGSSENYVSPPLTESEKQRVRTVLSEYVSEQVSKEEEIRKNLAETATSILADIPPLEGEHTPPPNPPPPATSSNPHKGGEIVDIDMSGFLSGKAPNTPAKRIPAKPVLKSTSRTTPIKPSVLTTPLAVARTPPQRREKQMPEKEKNLRPVPSPLHEKKKHPQNEIPVRPSVVSNSALIREAVSCVCLPGEQYKRQRLQVLKSIKPNGRHLIVFNAGHQFLGLYWNISHGSFRKLFALGPAPDCVAESEVSGRFQYREGEFQGVGNGVGLDQVDGVVRG